MGQLSFSDVAYALLAALLEALIAARKWGREVGAITFIVTAVILLYLKHQSLRRRTDMVMWLPMVGLVVGILSVVRLYPRSHVWQWLLVPDARVTMLLLVPLIFWWWPKHKRNYVRGAKVHRVSEAKHKARSMRAERVSNVEFLGVTLSRQVLRSNVLFVGSPGTGKTTMIRLLQQQLLPHIGKARSGKGKGDMRALIFDAKGEVVPHLAEMGVTCPVYILNPFDMRASAWDVAKDIDDMSMADTFVAALIEDDAKTQDGSFFVRGARAVVSGTLRVLMDRCPRRWTLSDLVYALDSPDRVAQLLASHPATASILDRFAGYDATWQGIVATISEKTMHQRRVGAIYRNITNGPTFSFSEWDKGEGIVVLGNDRRRRDVLGHLNRVMFSMASKILLRQNQQVSKSRYTFLFLDELHQAGKLDGLSDLLLTGRQFGCCSILGFQSRGSLTKPGLYSPDEAADIVENCATRAVFKCTDETAEWASRCVIGEAINHEPSEGTDGKLSWQQTQRRAVLPSTLLQLAHLETEGVYEAVCHSPIVGTWTIRGRGRDLFSKLRRGGSRKTKAYIERPASHQDESHLKWSRETAKQLGMPYDAERRTYVPRLVRARK